MKTIKVNNVELLLIPVPKDASGFKSHGLFKNNNVLYNVNGYATTIKLPSNNYKIVNTLSKLTEEQAKELVEDCIYFAKCYKKYNILELEDLPNEPFSLQLSCWTALESFHSLMIANEINTNNEYLILRKNE